MKKIILKIDGMSCSACANHVEKYLSKQKGIIDVSVNLVMGQALIYYEDNLNIADIGKYINSSGYQYAGIYDERKKNLKNRNKVYLIILAFLILFMMYISLASMFNLPVIPILNSKNYPVNYAIISFIISLPYLIYGRDIIINGIKKLIYKSPNMDTLISIGILVCFIYSFINMILIILGHNMLVERLYFESVCMIILFVKLGRFIDYNSREKTKDAIKELVKITPDFALLKNNGNEKKVTIDEVKVGDILIVKPGMKVAVDGEIIKGTSHFDESFITGESRPVKKGKGKKIVAGSINYDGIVEYKALKIGPKSTISQMVHLVLEASNSKMKISKIADKVSLYFVPIIMIISVLTLVFNLLIGTSIQQSLIHMVTVLVVACPCALGLATPLAIVVAIGTALKSGLLIKSSEVLEISPNIDTIVFDKTGTLTYGKLCISNFYNYSKYSDKELLNIVANIEANSIHPIAQAFNNYKIKELKVSNYQEISGVGITAKINKKTYCLGNNKFLKGTNNYIEVEKEISKMGSVIYIVEDNDIIGLIGVKDIIRKEAKYTVEALKHLGMDVIMLTGDNKVTANIIGKELGIDNIIADCLPSDKIEYIQKLKADNKKVIMVGDGINDAPSLTTADIGISFKGSTDIAANCSSVIITNNNLDEILNFLTIGKRTLRNIKQNLFWAFFYNILMIPIAIGLFKNIGLEINPMIASCAMMLSSLFVVFNALRLKKIKNIT